MNKFMEIAKNNSIKGFKNEEGGPFGAVIIDKDGDIVSEGNNKVLCNNDPTAHAEIVAIRTACEKLKTYDLSDYILYTSCEPCPMCLSAIIWANIKKVYYSADYKDAEKIGFRDDYIFKFLKNGCKDKEILELQEISKENIVKLYNQYDKADKTLY